jgi:hypothetical protein
VNNGKAKAEVPVVHPQEWGDRAERLREEEDTLLEAGGFELEGTDLWVKEGVWYGREAALQNARRG